MPYYLAPYIGSGEYKDPYRPAGTDGLSWTAIDFRPDASIATGFAIVHLAEDSADLRLIKLSDDRRENVGAAALNNLRNRLDPSLSSGRLDATIARLLRQPPSGKWKELLPTILGEYEIHLGGERIYVEPVIGGGATDDFNRANETPIAAPWTQANAETMNLVTNAMQRAATNDCAVYYAGAATGSNQYSQAVEITVPNRDWGPAARIAAGGSVLQLYFASLFGATSLAKFVTGTFGIIANPGATYSIGDVAKIECNGSSISFVKNTVSQYSTTDTSITGGQPGIFIFEGGGRVDTWEGGDLSTTPISGTDTGTGTDTSILSTIGRHINNADYWQVNETFPGAEGKIDNLDADLWQIEETLTLQIPGVVTAGPTLVFGTDTGTSSETPVLTVALTGTDTGTVGASGILDNFNRANSSNMGSNWATVTSLGSSMEINGNEAKMTGANANAWIANTYDADQEVSVTLKTVFTDSSHVWLLLQMPSAGMGSFTGYLLDIIEKSGVVDLVLYRGNSASYTTLATSVSNEPLTSGDIWTLRKVGANLTVLRNGVAVVSGSFTAPVVDGSPLNATGTYVGMGGNVPSLPSVDNFTVGTSGEVATVTIGSGSTPISGTDSGTSSETATLTTAITITEAATSTETPVETVTLSNTDIIGATGPVVLDDFNRANNTDLGSNWTQVVSIGANRVSLNGNAARIESNSAEAWNANTFPVDQEVSVTLAVPDGTNTNLWLLCSMPNPSAGSFTGYLLDLIMFDATTMIVRLYRGNAGSYTLLNDPPNITYTAGDVFTLQKGTTAGVVGISILQNGVTIFDGFRTDSSPITDPATYIGFGGNVTSLAKVDNFSSVLALSAATEVAFVTVPVSGTDTGTDSEASTLAATYTNADTSTGTDSPTQSATYSSADTGTSTESPTQSATYSNADTGTSSETGTVSFATVDTGTDTEAFTLTAQITDSDSATATEPNIKYVFPQETATSTETATLTVAITTTDTGTDSETGTGTSTYAVSDTGTSTETPVLAVAITSTDTGTDSESPTLDIGLVHKDDQDTGTDSEAQTLTAAISITDTGTSIETPTLTAALSDADTGTSSESGTVGIGVVNKSDTDTGTDSEAQTLAAALSITDTNTTTETATVGNLTFTVTDTNVCAETVTLTVALTQADTSVTTETPLIAITVTDTGTDFENASLNRPLIDLETGIAVDATVLYASITVSDSGTGTETAIKRTPISLLVTRVHSYRHWTYNVVGRTYSGRVYKHVTLVSASRHFDFEVYRHTTETQKEVIYR